MEIPMQLKVKLVLCKQEQVDIFPFLNEHVKIEICQGITVFTYCPYIKNLEFKYFQKHGVLWVFFSSLQNI